MNHSPATRRPFVLIGLLSASALCAGSAWAQETEASKPIRAGFEFKEKQVLQEMGLPAYPGAMPQKDSKDDKASVSLGLWGGPYGIKVQVAKFTSTDGVDKVANFYQQALTQYGAVLDCSDGVPRPPRDKAKSKGDDKALTCEDDSPSKGERVYKVGTAKNFRLVSVEPKAEGAHFQIVRIAIGRRD